MRPAPSADAPVWWTTSVPYYAFLWTNEEVIRVPIPSHVAATTTLSALSDGLQDTLVIVIQFAGRYAVVHQQRAVWFDTVDAARAALEMGCVP